jgi:hypothetical protein
MRDTIEMAREAGFERVIGVNQKTGIQTIEAYANDSLQRFEALVRADEREACYTIAKFNQSNHLEHLTADQIKARGETK